MGNGEELLAGAPGMRNLMQGVTNRSLESWSFVRGLRGLPQKISL